MSGDVVDGELVDPVDLLAQRQAELEEASARHERALQVATEARRAYQAWRFDDAVTEQYRANWSRLWLQEARAALETHAKADAALDAYVAALQAVAARPS